MIESIRAYWQAERDGDVEAVLAHYAPDAIFVSPGHALRGHAEIRNFYDGMTSSYADIQVEILRYFSQDEATCVEYICHLTCHDGSCKDARGCNVFRFDAEERFTSVACYYDPETF